MNKRRAFTLVEIIIAISIFMVVATGVYAAFFSGLFGYGVINEQVKVIESAQRIFRMLDTDLRNAFSYSENISKFQGTDNSVNFLSSVNGFGNEAGMRQYAFLSYKFEDNSLIRLLSSNLDAVFSTLEPLKQQIATGVGEVHFSYGFLPKGNNDIIWKNTWADDNALEGEKKEMPAFVRILVTLKGKTSSYTFERTIHLPLR